MSNPADDAFFFILGISVVLLALNTGVMLYFAFRYAKKRHPVAEEVPDNVTLEIIWTVIPTILVLVIFFVGWKGFVYMRTAPPDAMIVKVTARQWSWTFEYANGKQSNVLRVPVRKPVKLLITSADVLHSLFIPAYHIKEDAVPGRETHLWFLPDELGTYDLFCTEYCGVGHSEMITTVEVMPQKDFEAWYAGAGVAQTATGAKNSKPEQKKAKRPADPGAELISTKGCLGCHTTDGSPKIGPTFKGLFGRKETVLHGGKEQEIVVDGAFLHHKLLQPEDARIKGFPPIMPSQKGVLSDKDIDAIIAHLKTLQ